MSYIYKKCSLTILYTIINYREFGRIDKYKCQTKNRNRKIRYSLRLPRAS